MMLNSSTIRTSSDGAWHGENPLNYAFPLLIVQTILVVFLSRLLAFFLKPLRQPKVIAEILGGIFLGPSALGRNKEFMHRIFPPWSTPILESVSSIGLLFFLFLVGMELDWNSICRSGRRAFSIALAGISLPFTLGIGVTFFIRRVVNGEDEVSSYQLLVFMGVSLSITAFPVLARILAELKLLTTQVGEIAMAAAAFNDVAAWILLALAVALAGGHSSPLVAIWVLISGIAFVGFMFLAIRPVMNWVSRQSSSEHDHYLDETFICLTIAGVMVFGFVTDLIGIHAIFGAFVFGLTIPKGGEFAGKLMIRIEDFVSGLLLPLYFASSGLKTDVTKIQRWESWGLLGIVTTMACAGKILGTFAVAMLCTIPAREALTLGVLMNTKGLVELIVLNIGKEKKVLNDEMFAILVLMALFTTFMTTPIVTAIYRPQRSPSSPSHHRRPLRFSLTKTSHQELRILACVQGPVHLPSIINLIESTRFASSKSPLKLYAMNLIHLSDRSSSIMMVHRARRNGFPFVNRFRDSASSRDHIASAFEVFGRVSRVTVRHVTAISAFSTMHEDIRHVAEDKRVAMIVLPFHKRWSGGGVNGSEEETEKNVGDAWRSVNQNVLECAPCTVAVLVDRGHGRWSELKSGTTAQVMKRVCILFFGGLDDREALQLGGRMAEHPAISLTIIRFLAGEERTDENFVSIPSAPTEYAKEKDLDDVAVAETISKMGDSIEYMEKAEGSIIDAILTVGQSSQFELILVGKQQFPSTTVANLKRHVEYTELGPIGDILSSSGFNITPSVLVISARE